MQIDPVAEWRRLTEHYRQMSDAQLQELALDYADLTETAQQTLAGELRHRGLDQPRASGQVSTFAQTSTSNYESTYTSATVGIRTQQKRYSPFAAADGGADVAANGEDVDDDIEDDSAPREYTWKTVLCECEEWDQVWQLCEMLRRAGIESWSEGATSIGDGGLLYPRVLVAADQLDEARMVIARPIPQDVIDESRTPTPEFELPVCPSCRAEDPVLEDTDPVNTWRCESCGRQWSDKQGDLAPDSGAEPKKA